MNYSKFKKKSFLSIFKVLGLHRFVFWQATNIRELNQIGDNVSIGTLSVLEHHISIKDDVRIHSQVFIPEYTILEEYCWLGPNVVITNASYPNHPEAKNDLKGVLIKRNAKIGANTTILPGVIIGEGSLIGAGSVVTKDVNDKIIVAVQPPKPLSCM